ncbi:polysaccharide biosynthesis tyrosine autokinase [Hafnia psychrotolerans]|uniref:Tyrosine protein kinase n=1 Tax=Hafnia psychrotolerans TaxID=1477018 RepID=A0ABQ1GNP5_9GAMM|nr:polysaccharide biosynthesis tyrosine autokinase [Hafnia psychrotolerans]GGA47430.1 tyrosine protein kinase [Hafnia psychrotolerans]
MGSGVTKNTVFNDSDEINVGRLIGELVDHWKMIIAIVSFTTLIAIIYVFFSTPIYQASSLVQVEQKQGNSILSSLSQVLPDTAPQSAPEISLLQSRMILGKTVDQLDLRHVVKQSYFPLFGKGWSRLTGQSEGTLAISDMKLSSDVIGSNTVVVTIIDKNTFTVEGEGFKYDGHVGVILKKPYISLLVTKINADAGTEFEVKELSRLDAINNLSKAFAVNEQGKDSGMLSLTLIGENPALITKILDKISTNYLNQNIERQAAQDAKSLEFLNRQLPEVRQELDTAEDKLNDYRKQKNSVDLSLEAKSVLDQIVNVDNQLNELTFKEAEISQLYTKEHPTYKALLEKRATLENEQAKLNKQVSSMPSTQQGILKLSRDVESGRAVYMQLLNRQQELSISKSSAIGNVRIIDQAITDPKPVQPRKLLGILIGMFIGGFIAIGAIILKISLRHGIESSEELENLGVNVYANVPISEWLNKNNNKARQLGSRRHTVDAKNSLLFLTNPADISIEAIRGLRTSLHFAMMEAKNKVLMISGASPKAGKTFISSNLSATIANSGKKVLYIDADMRKGYVHRVLGVPVEGGLSDYLSGREGLPNIVKAIKESGFDFISRGAIPPNPAELLMHPRMQALVTWANDNYDLIVIDTPPVLAVTDAVIIGSYSGTTLLVARFEENTAKEIDISIRKLEQSNVEVKGCVLNGIVRRASSRYGYGYNGYGYSYADKN